MALGPTLKELLADDPGMVTRKFIDEMIDCERNPMMKDFLKKMLKESLPDGISRSG